MSESRRPTSIVSGALILAFVGAIEQNLLGMPGGLADHIKGGQLVSRTLRERIETYLGSTFV
jgi:hypothetical protein